MNFMEQYREYEITSYDSGDVTLRLKDAAGADYYIGVTSSIDDLFMLLSLPYENMRDAIDLIRRHDDHSAIMEEDVSERYSVVLNDDGSADLSISGSTYTTGRTVHYSSDTVEYFDCDFIGKLFYFLKGQRQLIRRMSIMGSWSDIPIIGGVPQDDSIGYDLVIEDGLLSLTISNLNGGVKKFNITGENDDLFELAASLFDIIKSPFNRTSILLMRKADLMTNRNQSALMLSNR